MYMTRGEGAEIVFGCVSPRPFVSVLYHFVFSKSRNLGRFVMTDFLPPFSSSRLYAVRVFPLRNREVYVQQSETPLQRVWLSSTLL